MPRDFGTAFDGGGDPAMPPPPAPNPWKWNFTKPSDDACLPPLDYWDDHRAALGKGMLPKVIGGCSVIVWGKKSSHKSGLLLKELLDAVLFKGAKVLYLACEGAHGIRTSRLPAACRQRGIGIEEIDDLWRTFPASPGLMNNAEIDELIAACRKEVFKPDIIGIDTLTRAVPGFDINAPATGTGLILGMERLGAPFNATVVAVTHPGKEDGKGAIGSSLIESLAFAILRVSLDGEAVFVEVQKMKDGPAEFRIPFKVVWEGPQGEVAVKQGVPVIVEAAPGEQLERDAKHQIRLRDDDKISLSALEMALGKYGKPSPGGDIPQGVGVVTEEEWRRCQLLRHSRPDDTTDDTFNTFLRRRRGSLQRLEFVQKHGDLIWLVKR